MDESMKKRMEIVMRVLRVLSIAASVAIAIGYFSFQMTMPSVVVPNTTSPSLIVPGLVFLCLGLLVGLIAESLETLTIAVLLGVVLGTILGWIIFISPTINPDIVIPDATGYFYNVLHSALPFLVIGLVTLFIGGFIGNSIMENLVTKTAPSPFESFEDRVKKGDRQKD